MRIKLPEFIAAKGRAARKLMPDTKLGRVAVWSGGLSAILMGLSWIGGSKPGSALRGWAIFFLLVFIFCAICLLWRWVIPRLLWRLRNRLGAAYIFIGVIPVMLLLLMGSIGSYLFAGQFAAYIAISDLQSTLQHLRSTNDSLATQLNALEHSGTLNEQSAGAITANSDEDLPERTVTVWLGDKSFVFTTRGTPLKTVPAKIPDAIPGDFNGIVIDQDNLHLRAVKHYDEGGVKLTVVSNIPITAELLQPTTARLGAVTVIPPDRASNLQLPPVPADPNARKSIHAGHVPPAANRFDVPFRFYTLFHPVDWETGKSLEAAIGVVTRPSMLYRVLFATLGDNTGFLWHGLLALAIFFGLIELIALYIAFRLSRSMTRSVAKLYSATGHVNRGDLTHRIEIRSRDQMASLEQSFNSMTESLARLVDEQKEKQRLESELAIAREVQDLLFPHAFAAPAALEVHGICRPARSVSGDYYDFISLGGDKMVLAVGDISGKGISAALLMATVHAFVRAYSLEPAMVLTPELRVDAFCDGDPSMYYRGGDGSHSQLAPGMLMTTLNYQLFHCTPPEKYATMFLGCYDAVRRELRYCNAGHLPPILVREDGMITRLETSGTVVGLFDGATYGESTIAMQPGDILVAFSDGVTEPENESGEFGEERLINLIQEHRQEPLTDICEIITGSVQEWVSGAELPDDLTVILARAN